MSRELKARICLEDSRAKREARGGWSRVGGAQRGGDQSETIQGHMHLQATGRFWIFLSKTRYWVNVFDSEVT